MVDGSFTSGPKKHGAGNREGNTNPAAELKPLELNLDDVIQIASLVDPEHWKKDPTSERKWNCDLAYRCSLDTYAVEVITESYSSGPPYPYLYSYALRILHNRRTVRAFKESTSDIELSSEGFSALSKFFRKIHTYHSGLYRSETVDTMGALLKEAKGKK